MESHLLDMLYAGNKNGKSLLLLAQSQQWDTWPENEWLLGLKMNKAKDDFTLSLYIGKEALISTNNNKKIF